MKTLIVGLIVSIGCLLPALAWSQSSLESPIGFVSGLGDVHGWICSAGNLTFTIDNGPPGALIYGASRGDTQGVCGDSNNGFITQFNWNLVGSGQHTIRVFNNGQQFAQSTFTVTTLGTDFLTGAASSCSTTIAGQNVTLTWQQNLQNYVITGAGAGANFPSVAGDWFVSLDFLTEDCNFISVPPDLPTHLSGSIHVNQSGGNLVVTQGTATFTGDLETNGAFTIVGVPNVSTAASCTYALTAGYGGNFLSNIVVFVVLATKVSGDCTGVSLPCSIGYSGSINKLAAQMALQQQDNVSPADAVRAIIEATQAQAH